ncbi:hypothetical protein PZA11_005216 [Diplocarpon coronariae]
METTRSCGATLEHYGTTNITDPCQERGYLRMASQLLIWCREFNFCCLSFLQKTNRHKVTAEFCTSKTTGICRSRTTRPKGCYRL